MECIEEGNVLFLKWFIAVGLIGFTAAFTASPVAWASKVLSQSLQEALDRAPAALGVSPLISTSAQRLVVSDGRHGIGMPSGLCP